MSENITTTVENGTAPAGSKMARLEELNKQFQAAKTAGKTANKKEQLELLAAFKRTRAAVEQAEAALQAAQAAHSASCEAIVVRAVGKANVDIEDVTWVPMSKGDKVYFRRLGSPDTVKLGG